MTWNEKKAILTRLGIIGFISDDHFQNWMDYENDDKQLENRIKNALCHY